jgi:hypothetical protein
LDSVGPPNEQLGGGILVPVRAALQNYRSWPPSILAARALRRMIGITISARAYAAIAATPSASSAVELEVAPDGEYRVWLSHIAVECLLALHEPGETFSDVILRLTRRGSLATATG